MTYERLLDEFADELRRAGAKRARRRRRPALAVLGLGLAAAAAVMVFVTSGPGSDRLDVVARARAALTPPGEIVHMVITTRQVQAGGTGGASGRALPSIRTEQWSAPDPPRWRDVTPLLVPIVHGHALRPIGRRETSYARGEQRDYDAVHGIEQITRGFNDDGPAAHAPALLGLVDGGLAADPARGLQALLARGVLHDRGLVNADGRVVRRLAGDDPAHSTVGPVQHITYDVDPTTFTPVAASERVTFTRHGHVTTLPESRATVDRYERIPLTAQTVGLLSIHPRANTRIVAIRRVIERPCRLDGLARVCPLRFVTPRRRDSRAHRSHGASASHVRTRASGGRPRASSRRSAARP